MPAAASTSSTVPLVINLASSLVNVSTPVLVSAAPKAATSQVSSAARVSMPRSAAWNFALLAGCLIVHPVAVAQTAARVIRSTRWGVIPPPPPPPAVAQPGIPRTVMAASPTTASARPDSAVPFERKRESNSSTVESFTEPTRSNPNDSQ